MDRLSVLDTDKRSFSVVSIYTGGFLCAHSMSTVPQPKVSLHMSSKPKPTDTMPTANAPFKLQMKIIAIFKTVEKEMLQCV